MEEKNVVLDNGSGMVKLGFSGDDMPQSVFPAVIGRPKHSQSMQGVSNKSEYIGEEAIQKKGILHLKYPIAKGIVESWEDMEKVWHHCFVNELRVEPSEVNGVLLTEAPRNPKENREKMITIMFETFEVRNCYVAIQAVMSLYAAGRTTGLVVDAGDGVSHTVPVFEGFTMSHAVEKMEIAGRVLTNWCQKLLLNAGYSYVSSAELEIVKKIKEELSYVALDYEKELAECQSSSEHDKQYELPDKQIITVPGTVRIQTPELLFNPGLNGMECMSMSELALKSVGGSDIDVRKDLLKNIILSGGTTMYEGITDRLKKEITDKSPAGSDIRIVATSDRKYSVWIGASTFCSLGSFASSWITASDYEEHGATIVHRKCQ